jgi:hypothetical protein
MQKFKYFSENIYFYRIKYMVRVKCVKECTPNIKH